jgi:hypothetical protein
VVNHCSERFDGGLARILNGLNRGLAAQECEPTPNRFRTRAATN